MAMVVMAFLLQENISNEKMTSWHDAMSLIHDLGWEIDAGDRSDDVEVNKTKDGPTVCCRGDQALARVRSGVLIPSLQG